MKATGVTSRTVRAYFDAEAVAGRRLLPDPATVSGLGTYRKYCQAVESMSDAAVNTVLDVGCNRGSIEFLFHQMHPVKAAKTVTHGIDVSTKAIAQATTLQLRNCTFQQYDGSILPYESNSFDLVVMVEVIEHVIDKERLLREVRRVLAPSGKLFLTTPNPECWALRAESALWWALRTLVRKPHPAKDAMISPRALATLLSRVGFSTAQESCRLAWPHLFIHFLGWSVLPPLPPKALRWYQERCVEWFAGMSRPNALNRRVQWSSIAVVSKPA